MGILDKKTRFIDLVITQEGKRQIAAGKLRAEFASLSDCQAFYDVADPESVSDRIYFEVMDRPENSIVLEKDDSGLLLPFDFSPSGSIVGNNVFSGSVESNVLVMKAATGSQFASTEEEILAASLRHFKNNYFIGSYDYVGSSNFIVEPKEIVFTINNSKPFGKSPLSEVINVDNAEPFFLDERLTHLPNFQYLPPINTDGSKYGLYKDIRNTTQESWNDIEKRLGAFNFLEDYQNKDNPKLKGDYFGNLGAESRKLLVNGELPNVPPSNSLLKDLRFIETSKGNNLIMQMFEDSNASLMTKLDIIDAGLFYPEEGGPRTSLKPKRVFYIGKVYTDSFNMPTFINMFTIVME